MDSLRSGQFALDFRFVAGIALSPVIRKQGYFMIARKMTQDVVGTDFAPGVDWKQLARFDPQNSQMVTGKSVWRKPARQLAMEKQ